jgi:hypothetical protein
MDTDSPKIYITTSEPDADTSLFFERVKSELEYQYGIDSIELIKESYLGTKAELTVAIQIIMLAASITIPILYDIIKTIWIKQRKKKTSITLSIRIDDSVAESLIIKYDEKSQDIIFYVKRG